MKKKSILIILLLSFGMSYSQENLIYNPSFEEYLKCPQKIEPYGYMSEVVAWWQPTGGSADYYNKCGSKQCNVPRNKLGIQMPRTGVGMVGIYTSKTDYREYIQTELKEYLIKGETYRLRFFVSLSEYSTGSVATIGGLFTEDRIEEDTREMLTNKTTKKHDNGIVESISTFFEPQVVNPFEKPLLDTEKWMEIKGDFVAEGGERFLTIGNFYPAEQSNIIFLEELTYLLPGAYYYIDDVELICLTCRDKKPEIENEIAIVEEESKIEYEVGQVVVLENIFFEFDKSNLLPQSFVELKNLIDILNQYPNMKIELSGHTDFMGKPKYNQRLSESRAKAVYSYLQNMGIDNKRIKYRGYGATKPIADNETSEGRAKNRRVEFRIVSL